MSKNMRPKINSMYRSKAQKPLPLKIVHYTFTKKLFMFNNSFSELFANPKNYPECMNKKKIFTETNLLKFFRHRLTSFKREWLLRTSILLGQDGWFLTSLTRPDIVCVNYDLRPLRILSV